MTHRVVLIAAALAPVLTVVLPAAAQCPADAGNCLAIHSTPGCVDEDCCNIVCVADPLCCDFHWDAACVQEAEASCIGLCGANVNGDCFVAHSNPACADEVCCNAVCAVDPYCCDTHWDVTCAFQASLNCETGGNFQCGDAGAGSCYEPHGNAACNNASCCNAVCKIDPSCCTTVWDVICASLASNACVSVCSPVCPADAISEAEGCGQDLNAKCYAASPSPVLQTLPCGATACGRIVRITFPTSKPDVDVWSVNLVDGDGDGFVGVRLTFASAFNGFACLVPATGCPPLATANPHVNSSLCVEAISEQSCVAPGAYYLVIAPGDWPTIADDSIACDNNDKYAVKVTCTDEGCGPVCDASAGPCYQFHKGIGCNDVACCESTCALEPTCCTMQWDQVCADTAIELCAPPPPNDTCATALPIAEGETPISTIGANSDGPLAPSCLEGVGDVAVHDIWFKYKPTKNAIVKFSTCGNLLTFDSAIAIYRIPTGGSCATAQLIACDDDAGASCLPSFASNVSVTVECGVTYYVRVGGGYGEGTLTISFVTSGAACPSPCPADLDGNGSVGASDLGILLGAWGAGGPADLDGNGTVGSADLGILLGAWGACP